MTEMPNVLWLEEISKDDIPSVGGKGASLGEMTSVGLPVPKAFVVTAQAFRKFLVETGLEDSIFTLLSDLDVDDNEALEEVSQSVKGLVLGAKMPEGIKEEILAAYGSMGDGELVVAVRSSATAEDLPDASFAGQQETYLNIKGETDVIEAVQMCWASLYGARAVYYRAKQGFDDRTVNIAVVIQQLIGSEKSGVMFSSHPVSGEPLTIIEGSWGLGEAVVSGSVSPDKYVYDRRLKRVVDRLISNKEYMIVPVGDHGTELVEIPKDRQDEPVLSNTEVERLAEYGRISEEHYGVPQDLEWGTVGDTIYILQSRPITTIGVNNHAATAAAAPASERGAVILEGNGASPGVASGPVIIVHDVKALGKVKDGDILVAKMTNPDMVPAMRKVSGIVTDEGGMTCHAAIVSRELGTPAVVGTKTATKTLKNGQMVTIDGEKGLVFEGASAVPAAAQAMPAGQMAGAAVVPAPIITATSIKVNVSMPEAAMRAAATGADGVGLLRIEHLILGLNKTPGWFIKNGKEEEFISELYTGIKTVLDAFPGKPVWVRTLDAPTDEFRNMLGGEEEPDEHNPMLGWRGIRRDLQSEAQFRMQVETFKRLWDQGYDNLGLMFPLVSHPDQFIRAKELIASWGVNVDAVDLGIMIEIPACAILIEDFCKAGISFASFGTNDLIQYTIAIDRNNQLISSMYWPKHPAVLKLIHDAIAVCRKYDVECSICGQAGSDPKMVEWLIGNGITSVSANIDAVPKIRETAARTEKRLILDAVRSKNAGEWNI
ncbi:phosphoenolpyruvate synthase [Methanofollis aquaemaris]|uniref:Phosphoenolpyruvate synthase n=1 Tax=Methanofollis aquaemaris TaxID=126734 RepID=A0A8A3S7P2_9EURY|nr:phosphoenolpyruvate synthase [Methanofollis aquaemaris]QSZ67704.1 phosphoenolpyruvate synthase [Methanofollis aquaemaris]